MSNLASPTSAQIQPNNLSLWQTICQYQPTGKLVKGLCVWLALVVMLTAIRWTDGFAVELLKPIVAMTDVLLLVCQGLLAVYVVVVLVDILLLTAISQTTSYRLQRLYPSNVAIFHPLTIELLLDFIPERLSSFYSRLLNRFAINKIYMDVYDDYPDQLQLIAHNDLNGDKADANDTGMPISLTLALDAPQPLYDKNDHEFAQAFSKRIVYPLQPIERGTGYFGALAMRIYSPLALFRRKISLYSENNSASHLEQTNHVSQVSDDNYLRVLADFTGLLTNNLSAVFEKGYDAGIQTIKEQGQGSEFLKLREYVIGDSMRQIDWKASSRQGRIMSKSYEDENDQDVVFLLDCGEQMRHKEVQELAISHANAETDLRELSYFDKVLNAVLLLAHVANKQGDRVGLMTFGGINNGEEKFIAPSKGVSLIRHLLNETADLAPTMQTSDYFQAAERLNKSIHKRSLVIVITNTRQEASDELIQGMKLLSRKHQLVFANLTEQSVQDKLDMKEMPFDADDALLYHALVSYQQTREKLHKQLRQQTASLCLATTANRLPMVLTDAYIRLKK